MNFMMEESSLEALELQASMNKYVCCRPDSLLETCLYDSADFK
jgi:hypothetical protein